MLWFVESDVAESALAVKLIEEHKVETRPERVSSSCLDENVCLGSVQKYFTHDGWAALLHVVEAVKKTPVWYCGRCTNSISDDTENSIMCDSCLVWYHFKCTGIKQSPKSKVWFCRFCYV